MCKLNILRKLDSLIAVKIKNGLFINVYFPVNTCISIAYDDILLELVSVTENILSNHPECDAILGGDFSLQCVNELSSREIFNDFVKSCKLKQRDCKVVILTRFTYQSEANNSKTFIYLLMKHCLIKFSHLRLSTMV